MSVIRIEHVYKDYLPGDQKVQALKDITLSFYPGVFLTIAGPSGSGKTTLLDLIGCIDAPTSGRIYINDVDVGVRAKGKWLTVRRNEDKPAAGIDERAIDEEAKEATCG